ncbi:MAG: hypothetical protein M3014_10140 [Chloroflexota bacterium]|nr:hypothetical protein [Chloroflexota bacterium]
MKVESPTLVIFQGGARDSSTALERLVVRSQTAATLDLISLASSSNLFSGVILVTEDKALRDETLDMAAGGGMPISVQSAPAEPFHFGEALARVCAQSNLERVVYTGGAALPLATLSDLESLALAVSGAGSCVAANNLYSSDTAAFYPASALGSISLPEADNDLAYRLHFKAGLPFAPLPRTLPLNFDIDTPTDLAVLSFLSGYGVPVADGPLDAPSDLLHAGPRGYITPPSSSSVGPRLLNVLADVPTVMPNLVGNLGGAYGVISTRRAEALFAGRISSWVWRKLEQDLPCQTRIISEERGMRASGREDRGEVRSILGFLLDQSGPSGLLSTLEQTCQAAFLDTRVLFAHSNLRPSRAERFASDALLPGEIVDPHIRAFTEAALRSSLPIVLGGHSLISGGVWALAERVRGSVASRPY